MFWNLRTNCEVRRTHWRKMVTTTAIVDAVNRHSEAASVQLVAADEVPTAGEDGGVASTTRVHEVDPNVCTPVYGSTAQEEHEDITTADAMHDQPPQTVGDNQAPLVTAEAEGLDPEPDDSDSETEPEHDPDPPRRSARIAERVQAQAMINNFTVRQGLREHREETVQAVTKELTQIMKVKKAATGVLRSSMTREQHGKVIRSSMFLKAKHDAVGNFVKVKARLVADGSQQDRTLYPDRSSPTAMVHSLFIALSIAANERRNISVIDIGGAYLNAKMTGEEVLMEMDPLIASITAQICPEMEHFLDKRGRMVVRLDRALYGCVQSAKLWFEELTSTLKKMGYTSTSVDPCVMTKTVNHTQCTLIIFVDDILAMCEHQSELDNVAAQLRKRYEQVSVDNSNDFSYLGMHIIVKDGKATVSMEGFVNDLMRQMGVTGHRITPATDNLFEPGESEELNDEDREEYHSVVAKLLYLGTHVRPDILTTVSYLCTRVNRPTELDQGKLWRLLQYVNGTTGHCIVLDVTAGMHLTAHIDASFGTHEDGKSHTGMCVMFGDGCVMAKSTKQKIVTKNSTEAELVALSDKISDVMRCHELIVELGYDVGTPVVMQDNASTISLVTRGGGKPRTKHMRVRQNVVLELVRNNELVVQYESTKNMLADILTKPLQGQIMTDFVMKISNQAKVRGQTRFA